MGWLDGDVGVNEWVGGYGVDGWGCGWMGGRVWGDWMGVWMDGWEGMG